MTRRLLDAGANVLLGIVALVILLMVLGAVRAAYHDASDRISPAGPSKFSAPYGGGENGLRPGGLGPTTHPAPYPQKHNRWRPQRRVPGVETLAARETVQALADRVGRAFWRMQGRPQTCPAVVLLPGVPRLETGTLGHPGWVNDTSGTDCRIYYVPGNGDAQTGWWGFDEWCQFYVHERGHLTGLGHVPGTVMDGDVWRTTRFCRQPRARARLLARFGP